MTDVKYKITFYSNWHCGSGLAAGADVDELVIKDRNGLPYVPGRTIKGLLSEAAMMLSQFTEVPQDSIKRLFGLSGGEGNLGSRSVVSFTNASLSADEQAVVITQKLAEHLYQPVASTAIDANGIANHSLRKVETTIPCVVYGQVLHVDECDIEVLLQTFQWVKRMGLGRNRGYGRCEISKVD